ncbi:MAG: hypothetical protein LQ345_003182 [Seirophora villosa]|nr:MAG: hypothetical protein LQ345_003182 [Seirophora villosa]
MVETSTEPSSSYQLRSLAQASNASRSWDPATNQKPYALNDNATHSGRHAAAWPGPKLSSVSLHDDAAIQTHGFPEKPAAASPPPAPPPDTTVQGEASPTIEPAQKQGILTRFYRDCKAILLASWINTLLVFVPVAIAVEIAHVSPIIVFALNAVAIIPLAGLLSYATESVASELGDTIGALMNVTFGNANEIRIVQASLLGSILANLLLILGMCFLYGGLRFREQIYNSTVTQMSACLLSLSVMSLLLPTAFHASFTDNGEADEAVLKISRGTSVVYQLFATSILLLVYVLYLLFQLKSHAYMYQSMPQHVIDEESHPGLLADMLHTSGSSSSSSSSSSSDSDGSSKSNSTAKRIKRVLRGRRRRKSSASSKDTGSAPSILPTPSANTFSHGNENSDSFAVEVHDASCESITPHTGVVASGDEADTDGEIRNTYQKNPDKTVKSRDFEKGTPTSTPKMSRSTSGRKAKKKGRSSEPRGHVPEKHMEVRQLGFSGPDAAAQALSRPGMAFDESPRRTFGKRGITNVLPAMPAMPRMLSTTVFSTANATGPPAIGPSMSVSTTNALHRSTSLPSRLNRLDGTGPNVTAPQTVSYVRPVTAMHPTFDAKGSEHPKKHLSRTSAILLLLTSTALVAVCAEFLVGSIDYLVTNTSVKEEFIGLIILPIVGNAAEHVTAVVVAGKNKMDLAIGVAVGSSIQIALFVTPVIVLLGWALQKNMSLYFSLFETISLFVSAFIINFLILDGRTNYLEGALLIAAYVIIGLAAFFYPDGSQQSPIGGAEDPARMLVRMF